MLITFIHLMNFYLAVRSVFPCNVNKNNNNIDRILYYFILFYISCNILTHLCYFCDDWPVLCLYGLYLMSPVFVMSCMLVWFLYFFFFTCLLFYCHVTDFGLVKRICVYVCVCVCVCVLARVCIEDLFVLGSSWKLNPRVVGGWNSLRAFYKAFTSSFIMSHTVG